MSMFGREQDLAALATGDAKAVVVAGEAGSGKSALLTASQQQSDRVAADVVESTEGPGSLQRSLLTALARAVAALDATEGPAARLERLVKAAALKLAQDRLAAITDAAARVIRGYLTQHLGAEVVGAGSTVVAAVVSSQGHELERRIQAQGDPDVMAVIAALAGELATMAGGTGVRLAVDDLHKLNEDDRRHLRDFIDHLPPRVQFAGAFTTLNDTDLSELDKLKGKGAKVVQVEGLTEEAVAAWMVSLDIDAARAGEVRAVTDGIPLFVDAALLIVEHFPEKDIADLGRDDLLDGATRQAWAGLDAADQTSALLLACLDAKPSARRACQLLEVDDLTWHALSGRLVGAGVFLAESRWFHQLRRLCLRNRIITREYLRAAQRRTIERTFDWLRDDRGLESEVIDALRLVGRHPEVAVEVADNSAEVSAIASCSDGALAVLSLLVELYEPASPSQAVKLGLLEGTLRKTKPHVALGRAVDELDRLHLIAVHAGLGGMVLAPAISTDKAWCLMVGRCSVVLDHLPIAQAATMAFKESLRPHIVPFHEAIYGIGTASLTELAGMAKRLQTPRGPAGTSSPRWPSLAVRARLDSLPIYAVVAYNQPKSRDRHVADLDGFSETILGSDLVVTDTWSFPDTKLPLYWFPHAYNDLNPERGGTPPQVPDPATYANLAKATHDLLRESCSAVERDALGIEETVGYRYATGESGSWAIVEIRGGDTVEPFTDLSLIQPSDAESWLARPEKLGLGPGESVGRINWGSLNSSYRPADPIREVIDRAKKAADVFNRAHIWFVIPYTLDALQEAVNQALPTYLQVRDSIRTRLLGLEPEPPSSTYAVIDIAKPTGNIIPGADHPLSWMTLPSPAGSSTVHIAHADPMVHRRFHETEMEFWQGHFPDITVAATAWDGRRWGSSMAWEWVACRLGFDRSDIWLNFPGLTPPARKDDPIEWDLADDWVATDPS